jgi:sporulation protein YlmC with PRC-barrel domain
MRPSELNGKKVVGAGAKIVGTVFDVEIDPVSWKVTHLQLELSDEAIEILGYKKSFMGRVDIFLSVDAVAAVADIIGLNKPMTELKEFIQPPK